MTADAVSAPGEIYRDPVYDGATDPTVVRADDGWWMFYTQRRATHPDPGPNVAWVHGSRIGIARSADGEHWTYVGTLEPDAGGLTLQNGHPPTATEQTHWAPEVIWDGERWRMYLTEIEGVPDRWDGYARHIVEYLSEDLSRWVRRGPIPLSSDRVIDAAVARCPDGLWRLWYKDEAADSTTWVASSADLDDWRVEGMVIGGRPHEGPFVFPLGGWWWMLTDEWRGMAVYRSSDALSWARQRGADAVIVGEHGAAKDGIQVGRHGAVTIGDGRARLYYFTHPWWDGSELSDVTGLDERRSAVYRAELSVLNDALTAER